MFFFQLQGLDEPPVEDVLEVVPVEEEKPAEPEIPPVSMSTLEYSHHGIIATV